MKVYNPITKMMEDKSKSIKAKDSKEDERKSYYYIIWYKNKRLSS